jgi:hypothetical protein
VVVIRADGGAEQTLAELCVTKEALNGPKSIFQCATQTYFLKIDAFLPF